jgi:hypothetical protein
LAKNDLARYAAPGEMAAAVQQLLPAESAPPDEPTEQPFMPAVTPVSSMAPDPLTAVTFTEPGEEKKPAPPRSSAVKPSQPPARSALTPKAVAGYNSDHCRPLICPGQLLLHPPVAGHALCLAGHYWRNQEVGSGVNDQRPKFQALLGDKELSLIVVEHRDRATRFGFSLLAHAAGKRRAAHRSDQRGSEGDKDELMQDLIAIITSFVARYYGQRRAKRKTEKIIQELQHDDGDNPSGDAG